MCNATTQKKWSRDRKTASNDNDPPNPPVADTKAMDVGAARAPGGGSIIRNGKGAPHQQGNGENHGEKMHCTNRSLATVVDAAGRQRQRAGASRPTEARRPVE